MADHGSELKLLELGDGGAAVMAAEERPRQANIGQMEFDLGGNQDDTFTHLIPPPTLQDQLAHLDLSLHGFLLEHRSVPSSNRTSRRPSVTAAQEAAHVEWLPNQAISHMYYETDDDLLEDVMDISESPAVPFDPALSELNAHVAAASQAATASYSYEEEPCRPHPDSNHDMSYFLGFWRFSFERNKVSEPISLEAMQAVKWERPSLVSHEHVTHGISDMQGIDWSKLGNTWEGARSVRKLYHQHPMVRQHPQPLSATELPDTEEFFQFRQMNMEHRAWIDHYQLRNLMVSTSHSDVYYVARSRIMHTNSSSVRASCVMDLTDPWTSSSIQAGEFRVTALASAADILVAGGYRGEYALQNLRSEYGTSPVKGFATHNRAAITNHLHTSTTRTNGSPQAIFCSNDKQVRVLDCFTDTFVNEVQYEDYVNCAATSPNGRLRLLVGDFEGSMIVDADSGRLLKHLDGHINNAFACAWADDDIHVATAAEDCHILVWDARNWSKPLGDIANETSHTTSLHFSPLGSGKRLLIAAESADIVNVIDANTYSSKQVLPFFGDIAGVSISVDGSQLLVANGDRKFGGLITYQRDDYGKMKGRDWLNEYDLDYDPRVKFSAKARSRRGLDLDDIEI